MLTILMFYCGRVGIGLQSGLAQPAVMTVMNDHYSEIPSKPPVGQSFHHCKHFIVFLRPVSVAPCFDQFVGV